MVFLPPPCQGEDWQRFLGKDPLHESVCHGLRWSALFENENPAVIQEELFRLPVGALIELIPIVLAGLLSLIEPVSVGFFIGNPFFDGWPGRVEGGRECPCKREEVVAIHRVVMGRRVVLLLGLTSLRIELLCERLRAFSSALGKL